TEAERFELMDAEKANFEIKRMARLLGVSRSGYYQWAQRRGQDPGPQAVRQEALDAQVRHFYDASDRVYGAPRMTGDLHDAGVEVNVKTVAASMRCQRLVGIGLRMSSLVTMIPWVASHHIGDYVQYL